MAKVTIRDIIELRLKKARAFRLKCTSSPNEFRMVYDVGANLLLFGRDQNGDWSIWDETGKWYEEEYNEHVSYFQ